MVTIEQHLFWLSQRIEDAEARYSAAGGHRRFWWRRNNTAVDVAYGRLTELHAMRAYVLDNLVEDSTPDNTVPEPELPPAKGARRKRVTYP